MLRPMTPRRQRAAQRRRRWILTLLALGALFLGVVYLALPRIAKAQAQTRLSALLHRPVTIGKVGINPLALSVTVENLEVREPDGKAVFLSWERFYASFELISFVRHKWKFTEIELDGPRARVVVNPDGSLNFSDLLSLTAAGSAGKAPAAKTKPVVVTRFVLKDARLDFADRSRAQPFATTLGPVGFSVRNFHTMGSEQSPYRFEAVTESGEKLTWDGWVEAVPFRSGGVLSLSGIVLKKYAPYYAEKVGVDLLDGRLSVTGRYAVSFDGRNRMLKLLDGSLKLRNLRLAERATGEMLLDLPAADVIGVTADGLALKAAVQRVDLEGGHLRLRRAKDGTLNLAALAPPAPAQPMVAPRASAAPFAFTAATLALGDWTIDVQDLAAPRPVQLGLSGLNARLDNFSLVAGAAMPFEVAVRWQPKGTVRALGTVMLQPLKADLKLQVDSIGLLPLSPYLEQNVNARLADGTASVSGRVTVDLPAGQPPAATFDGDAWLERFSLLDNVHVEELAGFSDLILNGLKVSMAPGLAVALDEMHLNAPYAHMVLDRDKALNLAAIIAAKKSDPETAPAPAVSLPGAPAAGPDVEVGRVVINGGGFSFADQSITPQARLTVEDFGGTLTGLSSRNPGRGEADLHASLGGAGALAVKGRIDPLGANLLADTKISLQGLDLLPFSPYAGKFAGFEIARGKLFLEVTAKVADRKIDLADNVTLDQFTFGRATNSPDATSLPVRFGVSLLKDLDGKIVLAVPVQGSLDDPDFKIGGVVWHVIGNLLTKAAASPFTLLGSMFGGGGEELGWQDFSGGESTLAPDGIKKLDTLVKALTARPGLNLALEGGFDAAADSGVLRQTKLTQLVRRTIWESRHATDPNLAPPEQLEISPADYNAMIKRLFDRKFPPGTEFGTPLPPPPEVPPPPPPSNNILQRVIDFVILKKPREMGAYRVAQQKAQQDYMKQLKAVAAAGLPLEDMTARLVESMTVTPDDLRALADARVQHVRDYLVNEGRISPDRLFLTQPAEAAAGETAVDNSAPPAGKGAKVFFKLQ